MPRGGMGMTDHAVAGSHAGDAELPAALNESVQALGTPADCCCPASCADHLQLWCTCCTASFTASGLMACRSSSGPIAALQADRLRLPALSAG